MKSKQDKIANLERNNSLIQQMLLDNKDKIIGYIDGVNFLTVNPGFAGQQILDISYKKAEKLIEYLDSKQTDSIEIEVDGNMDLKNIKIFKELGANIFVAGTSSIFGKNDIKNEIGKIKDIIINED